MTQQDELYTGIGDFYPYLFYARLTFDNNPGQYTQLYNTIDGYKKNPYVFIFELRCHFLANNIILDDYDFIYLERDQGFDIPPNDVIEHTIKTILNNESWTDNLIYSVDDHEFYILDNAKLLEITLTLMRSLKKPTNIRIIKV